METQGECITSKVRPGLANAPLGVGRDLRSRTAALSNPLCYPIGASEVRAYGEPPSTSRPTSRRFPPARALVFPFSSLMPSHQRSGVRQHRPRYGLGRQGGGGGARRAWALLRRSARLELTLCASGLLIRAMPQPRTPPNELG